MRVFVRSFIFATLFLISIATLAAVPPITVRSGHSAPITGMQYDSDNGVLFSAGSDGKLIVWDTESGRLLQSIRADQLPIQQVHVYPDGERIALYSSDGRRNRITVWNWRDGERLFLHTPEDEVLMMTVSPDNSYVLYSTPSRESLRILNADSGRQLPFLRGATGIIGWMVVADSEERVMTYAPSSGRITYRTIVTGRNVAEFTGPADLEMLTLLETNRYAAARNPEGRLVVVDLLSGDVVDTIAAGTIASISLDERNGDIVVVSSSFGVGRSIRRYRFGDGELKQRYATRRQFSDDTTHITLAGRGVFASNTTGAILRWLPFESEPTTFSESTTEPIMDLHVTDRRLHMLTGERVITIASDFFSDQARRRDDQSSVRQNIVEVPAGDRSRFIATPGQELLVWTPSNAGARLQEYTIETGLLTPSALDIGSGLASLDAYENEVLTLSRSGVLELRDRTDGQQLMEYRGRGLQTAIRTSRGVFIGKAAQGLLDSSILRVNTDTRETVPLDSEADLVFFLDYDERRGRLFAIGIRENNRRETTTVVEVFEGTQLDRRRTILEIPGEYLDAELIHDPVTGTAYTTLDDRGGILRWDGSRVSELLRNHRHIPRKIYLQGEFLISLNRDGTVSVLDRSRGEPVIDLYVAGGGDGSWVAIRTDGRFIASHDRLATNEFLSLNEAGATLRERRIDIREQELDQVEDSSTTPRIHRFDSAGDDDDDQDQEESDSEEFDPFSGDPAPSS
ncbi:MAG: WD40 repeat domain-containing protein [Alkalispirochaeta sp.]